MRKEQQDLEKGGCSILLISERKNVTITSNLFDRRVFFSQKITISPENILKKFHFPKMAHHENISLHVKFEIIQIKNEVGSVILYIVLHGIDLKQYPVNIHM